ncbi:PIN domain-containing protein, partial [Cereibacter sphaeroides]|nr:PIN domain-containing protein [Cereibacter sphaeroides]
MSAEFVDTNIVLYLLDEGPKADRAETILAQRPCISVQVLNEAMVNCRRKAGLTWIETGTFLAGIQTLVGSRSGRECARRCVRRDP